MVELLKDRDAPVRGKASYALVNIFNNNVINVEYGSTLPALMMTLKDQDDTVRAGAAASLEYFAKDNEVDVPALIAALRDKNGKVRTETKDHTVSGPFVQLVRSRKVAVIQTAA